MKRIYVIILGFILCFSSCKEEMHKPLFKGEKPVPIADYSIENLPGAAKITCDVQDPNTLYVKAIYTPKEGLTREAKASKFDNVLVVNAFPESKDYQVKIYAVGKDEKESKPTEVTVHPETPPYMKVQKKLKFTTNYGGATTTGENITKASLMVGVITKDSTGEWIDIKDYFSNSKEIHFSFRGYKPVERKFGIYVRDQWQNYSDTTFYTIIPWEEVKIDMSDFKPTIFPGDAPALSAYPLRKMFNGVKGAWPNGYYSQDVGTPQHITIKLPSTYQLSRFRYWQNSNLYYQSSNPKHIRIWGSMEPNQNGAMDSTWYLLGDFDNWKPSGLPPGQLSDEDIEKAQEGNEFDFGRDIDSARYIRFETLETYQPRPRVYIVELALWGREID